MTEIAAVPIEAIVSKVRALAPELKAHGVLRLYLFGSRARGNPRRDSDLDVLVETTGFEEAPRFDWFAVLNLLRDSTGLEVQIATKGDLKPRMAERIADDLIEVF